MNDITDQEVVFVLKKRKALLERQLIKVNEAIEAFEGIYLGKFSSEQREKLLTLDSEEKRVEKRKYVRQNVTSITYRESTILQGISKIEGLGFIHSGIL